MNKIDAAEIKKMALAFDDALENNNLDKILDSFTDDCEIELLNIKLVGKEGVKKWFNWLYKHIKTLKLIPITIIVEDSVFFEEFLVKATLKNGKTANSKQTEILVYDGLKIKSLRLYFDRLDFSSSIAKDFITKTVIKQIIKKSIEGLS